MADSGLLQALFVGAVASAKNHPHPIPDAASSAVYVLARDVNNSPMNRATGFTLVELAIVVLLAGILMTAGLQMLIARMESAQLEATRKHQETIKQALISYLGKYRRLPCPDADFDGREDRDAYQCVSHSDTTKPLGVPYIDLGLDRATVLDGWENYITYVVSPGWRLSYSPTPTDPKLETASVTSAFLAGVTTGEIALYGRNLAANTPSLLGNPCPTLQGTIPQKTGAAIALVSHGRNGYGARTVKGTTNDPTGAHSDETQNITPSADSLVAALCPTEDKFRVFQREAVEPFDDVVMAVRAEDLTGPLMASGILQSSSSQALSQANDIVMGTIVASRKDCSVDPPVPPCSPGDYYYTFPAREVVQPLFPPAVNAWGVDYDRTGTRITSTSPAAADLVAYTLTAADGTSRSLTIGELRGILTRGAGFN